MQRILGMMLALAVILGGFGLTLAPAAAHDDHGDHGGGGSHEEDGDDGSYTRLVSVLTGNAEVNAQGVPGQGDLDGGGLARVRLSPERGRACINAQVLEVDPLVAAHIHNAPAGKNGPIVVDFTGLIDGTKLKGCVDADPVVLAAIVADPASYYVNVHSQLFRGGAVRGQLDPKFSLRSVFPIKLLGSNEVEPPGDPNGSGNALVVVLPADLQVCIGARVRNTAPLTVAHIHQAPAGSNGPVVVDFTTLIRGNEVRGCVSVEPGLLQSIRSNPAGFYVNVHSEEFPRGAVRGQLR